MSGPQRRIFRRRISHTVSVEMRGEGAGVQLSESRTCESQISKHKRPQASMAGPSLGRPRVLTGCVFLHVRTYGRRLCKKSWILSTFWGVSGGDRARNLPLRVPTPTPAPAADPSAPQLLPTRLPPRLHHPSPQPPSARTLRPSPSTSAAHAKKIAAP